MDWQFADYEIDFVKNPKLPFSNNSQKIIYSAHLIEHLPQATLTILLRECCRVLKPGAGSGSNARTWRNSSTCIANRTSTC